MIENWWVVIDPKMDRPFFSSHPPPATLVRTPGMQVIRFEVDVDDPIPIENVIYARSQEDMRAEAQRMFNTFKSFFTEIP